MLDSALSTELEALLLRQLASSYRELNDTFFKGRLRVPTLALHEGGSRLGEWRQADRHITLGRQFVVEKSWGSVLEVLKHEMAHQFVCEILGDPDPTPHGPAFRALCERLGIDGSASGLPEGGEAGGPEERRVLGRIAKLLALAESPNQHEAELAMAEAQRLLLKHNLAAVGRAVYSFRHLGVPTGRVTAAERALAQLLGEFFFVETIWIPVWRPLAGKRGSVLEICGSVVNLAIAEHAHAFLLHTAESLWQTYRGQRRLGNRDRQAYLAGVMGGFHEKLAAERRQSGEAGLVWVGDGDLERYWRRRHPYVRWRRHGGPAESEAHVEGRAAGRTIVLHRAVHERSERGRLLGGRS